MRKVNFVFLVGSLTVLGVSGAPFYLLHHVQLRRNASALFDRARAAEAAGNLSRAEESLTQFLGIHPGNGPAWALYARVLDEETSNIRGRERVFLTYGQALRFNSEDRKLMRRTAEMAIELERHDDALRYLKQLLTMIEDDPKATPETAELEHLLGQCQQAKSNFDEAERLYRQSIEHDPTRTVTFDRLARLLRQDMRKPDIADREIEAMMAANAGSASAHVIRYRYRREFGPAADKNDIARALQLDSDDAEVLIAAATLAQESNDLAGARKYAKRGLERHSANPMFYRLSAAIELSENHPDRAETILRKGVAAIPGNVELKIALVESLISQGKVDGEDGASAWIENLRTLGLVDGCIQYLEARVAMVQQKWPQAISRFESAQALLAADPVVVSRINLMLAECYQQVPGSGEQRIASLQRAASGETNVPLARTRLAQAMENEGRLDEAIRLHTELIATRPESRLDLLRLLIRKTRQQPPSRRSWEPIEQRLEEAEKALPQAPVELTLLRADLLAAEGRREKARQFLEDAIRRDPQRISYRVALARLLLNQAQDPPSAARAALKVLDQAEWDLGRSSALSATKIQALARMGTAEARQAIHKIAEELPSVPGQDQPMLIKDLATALLALGDRERSVQLMSQLASRQPEDLPTQMSMFDLAMVVGDHSEVAKVVERLRKIEGENGTNWRYADGLYYLELARAGDKQAMEHALTRTVELDQQRRDWWGTALLRAQVAEQQNKLDEAAANYFRVIELANETPFVARRLVGLLTRMEQYDRIDRVLQMLKDRGQDVSELTLISALNAIRRNEPERGLAQAREVLDENSTNPSDLLLLGRMYVLARKLGDADRPLKRALELAPGSSDAWLSYIQLLALTNRKDQAAKLIVEAGKRLSAELGPVVQARAYELLGDQTAASKSYQIALDRQPDSPGVLCPAAEFFARTYQNDKAIPILERFVDPMFTAADPFRAWARRTLAGCLMSTRNPAARTSAFELLEINRRENPESIEDLRAQAILTSMDPGKRAETIRLFSELETRRGLDPREEILLIEQLDRMGLWDQVEPRLQKLVATDPSDPGVLVQYVDRLIRRQRIEDAARWLGVLEKREPAALRTIVLKAHLAQARGDAAGAQETLNRFITSTQEETVKLTIASELEAAGDLACAEALYRRHVAQATQAERVFPLAEFLARTGRVNEALALCEPAWATKQAAANAAAISVTALERGRPRPEQVRVVESHLDAALKQTPDDPGLVSQLARLRVFQERWDDAEILWRKVIARDPRNFIALNELAWVLSKHRAKYSEGMQLIQQAIALAGPDSVLLDTRGILALALNQSDQAIADFKSAQAINRRPVLLFHLAQAYQQVNDRHASLENFRQAKTLGLDPNRLDSTERMAFQRLERELGAQ
jgi:cellulose synthase operon protein C